MKNITHLKTYILEKRKITQKQAARELNISYEHFNLIVNGHRAPTPKLLREMAPLYPGLEYNFLTDTWLSPIKEKMG